MDSWRQVQRKNFTNISELANFLHLSEEIFCSRKEFPLNVPYRLAEKMEKGRRDDPLLLQFVPLHAETATNPLFAKDAVGDGAAQRTPRLLHKYRGRALLLVTGACAMHCRYCFRQHFPYDAGTSTFSEELAYLRSEPSIREIILSGGDPLSLSNRALAELLQQLDAISHLKRIRFHTRFPIGIPERIDESLLETLGSLRAQVVFVVHSNHPRELDHDVIASLTKLRKLGIPLLNQAVLLRGVNDDVDTLHALCETLADNGVLPYYLHQLDRVEGATHFEVDTDAGLDLIDELSKRTSGYAIPRYVREIEGEASKTPLV